MNNEYTPTMGSLFSGFGGFELPAEWHGAKCLWQSEIEPWPVRLLAHRFPDAMQLGDITKINGAEIPPVDFITFGSPCQDMSVAGKREGIEGSRSVLFYEATRIIREMREATNGEYPHFAIWENVPGSLTSHNGGDFRAVLEEITEAEIPMPDTGRWADSGMVRGGQPTFHGVSWMPNIGESPSEERESSLWQIIRLNAPQKFSLSPKACQGILRRAANRGKELPELLRVTLERQASGSAESH
ncbi:MAG: DNA (cytosine-5-)-methyltransferase [Clostridia bacterium]|nr:DNA (cytosine-5-)-methyltransferase [Clostridia bacterium]